VQAFFTARRVDLDGKILDQYLEQLRVAVRFKERESASFVAYLTRVMNSKR
jgi:puromycin-sensitive aminopeptidase